MKHGFAALALLLLAACAHSTITPFPPAGSTQPKTFPPTDPAKVGIYRSTNPYPSFTELGLISFRSHHDDLAELYGQIRRDAAEYGADAVVDMKVSEETHVDTRFENVCHPETVCGASGCATEQKCNTEPVTENVTTYLITGSMIKGKP